MHRVFALAASSQLCAFNLIASFAGEVFVPLISKETRRLAVEHYTARILFFMNVQL